ncbi:probable beta-hexosaminidase fdl [Zophobas morio]|uniref:probable beta-hexosaminidase fdl n=1 Tax=Zophobas morio TaxID=2755281 RepID=UPI003082F13A
MKKTRQFSDSCSSVMFVMFVMSCFLVLFSYTDSLSHVNNALRIQNTFFSEAENDEFEVVRYTWKCESNKCVRYHTNTQEVSLNTCNMMCSQPSLWPKPEKVIVTYKNSTVIDKTRISFNFSTQWQVYNMLINTTDLFKRNLELLKPGNQTTPRATLHIIISIQDTTTDKLKLGTNEKYHLVVENNDNLEAVIVAETYFGARHALETLSQLIWYDDVIDELRILHNVDIIDSPKFPHRGVMIDTARNYFPLDLIKKVVDGMAMSKLNVLHLHVTDAVSFPIVLPRVKQLAAFGAYGRDMIYSPEDIKNLVQYSLTRGIKVLLEVDAPGHVNAGWNFAGESLNKKYVICGESDILNGHLNPDNDEALLVLEDIYNDLLELSGYNEMFHMGSDEVNLTCWKGTQAVKTKKAENSMKQFWASYTNQMLERLKIANDGRYPDHIIMWSSPLTESSELDTLDVKVTIQHWLGNPSSILRRGHKVIYSTVGQWYLDCGFGMWKPSMTSGVCDPYTPWQKFYKHRPWVINGYRELALGGEVCLWTEEVEVDSLETRIWPRSAAFAERVWSDPDTMNDYDVYSRLVSFVDRLRSRGIKSSAMWPRWCSQNPGKC